MRERAGLGRGWENLYPDLNVRILDGLTYITSGGGGPKGEVLSFEEYLEKTPHSQQRPWLCFGYISRNLSYSFISKVTC